MEWNGMKWCLNLRPGGTTRGKRSIIKWEGCGEGCGYSRLGGGSPAYVDWGPLVVDPWTSIWLRTNRMLDLWGMLNWHNSMIVVVGRYYPIPLEMSIGIVYGPPTDSLKCGIAWKTCTSERWDPNRPYGIVVSTASHPFPYLLNLCASLPSTSRPDFRRNGRNPHGATTGSKIFNEPTNFISLPNSYRWGSFTAPPRCPPTLRISSPPSHKT
jgi:hypothetical protein